MLNSVALQIPVSHDRCYFFYWEKTNPVLSTTHIVVYLFLMDWIIKSILFYCKSILFKDFRIRSNKINGN